MSKFTKSILAGVIAVGLLAPMALSPVNPVQTTVNAKRRRHHARRSRRSRRVLPPRFYGKWYGRAHGSSVWLRCTRYSDYLKAPKHRGYIHPKYWTGGMYGGYYGQYGRLGRKMVFNGLNKHGFQAAWYLHRI